VTRRRTVVIAIAAALAPAALRVAAQPARGLPRVVILSNSVPLAEMAGPQPAAATLRALVDGLRALGHIDGRNVVLERRSAEGRLERIHDMVREAIALEPDVIVTFGPLLLQAARQATTSIAIVAVGGGLGMSMVDLARPGGNFTGLMTDAGFGALNGKRLELLKEAVPAVTRVAVLRPPPVAAQPLWTEETERAARSLGLALSIAVAGGPDEFDGAFAAIVRDRAHAILCVDSPANVGNRQRVVDFAARVRLPTIYGQRSFVDVGGLISYGVDLLELSRQAAVYIDKILKGAKPGDLPIQQPTRFELAINQRAARLLGITMPQRLLLRADMVVD
jgi:putative ABC transport system substrate-binding protein